MDHRGAASLGGEEFREHLGALTVGDGYEGTPLEVVQRRVPRALSGDGWDVGAHK